MAMVNLLNGKDSRWLQLEVCREFQRNKCSRPDTECKFAHPPANVEVQNGRVTACYDSIKGRCNREKPPCKYFHPPQHLKDQLLINGRNHLALKNALMQQMGLAPGQSLVPGQVQAVAANPYLTGVPQGVYSPYVGPAPIMQTIMGPDPTGVGSPLGVVPQTVVTQQKVPRSDRLEMDMKSVGSFYYENFAFPAGMVPYKRPAADKSGMPVYQPNATTYQQLMQLQQPFVPVSCEYSATSPAPPPSSNASPIPEQAAVLPPMPPQPPQPPQQTQAADSVEQHTQPPLPQIPHSASLTVAPPLPALPAQHQQLTLHDPAALAKEVAQQNYAKAIKLAAVNQSNMLAANQLNQLNQINQLNQFNQMNQINQLNQLNQLNSLNSLNYTGVALNKHILSMPPPTLRYPSGFSFLGTPSGLNLGLNSGTTNPYSAAAFAQHQANALNVARPPPTMTPTSTSAYHFNPYSLMRPTAYANYPTAVSAASASVLGGGLLGAQYSAAVSASQMTSVTPASAAAASIAAAAAQNNNNVVMPPYKKLKTS